jgi:hypothetical protein
MLQYQPLQFAASPSGVTNKNNYCLYDALFVSKLAFQIFITA